eukprot:467181_1
MAHISLLQSFISKSIHICILFLYQHTQSQYVNIWFDNMNTNNNGWIMNGDVSFPYSSLSCGNYRNVNIEGTCARTRVDAYIQQSTNITSYNSIQLQVDVSNYDLDSGDYCYIWYQYDNEGWQVWDTYYGAGSTDYFFDNQILDASPSVSGNPIIFDIRLGVSGSGDNDYCYYDNVYLKGITKTDTPTALPTPSPTSNPTLTPTINPTQAPSSNPTNHPNVGTTKYPTNYPTNYPFQVAIQQTIPTLEQQNIQPIIQLIILLIIHLYYQQNYPQNIQLIHQQIIPTLQPQNIQLIIQLIIHLYYQQNYPQNIQLIHQ